MKYAITLSAVLFTCVALTPVSWSQMVPETNPRLAPARSSAHPTSSESLAAQAQDLTKKIDQARAEGKDTSAASAEQARAEQAMQQGKEQEALEHFKAGEHALGMDEPQH